MDSQSSPILPTRRPSWTGALGAKLGRILGPSDERVVDDSRSSTTVDDGASWTSMRKGFGGVMVAGKKEDSDRSPSADRRSVSRGREAFSSGRGGIGNIRRTSIDAASPVRSGGEPIAIVRGRETTVDPERAKTTGRGGAGNIHSPSRTRPESDYPQSQSQSIAEYEKEVIQQSEQTARAQSSGRGGLGNIRSDSSSRSRSRAPQIRSTGRGGAGNIHPSSGDPELLEQLEEEEREIVRHAHAEGPHSTGRGGRANITDLHSPPPEPSSPHPNEYETTGRGGVGNMVRSRSGSREPSGRSASRGSASNGRSGSLARVLGKMHIHGPGPHEEDGLGMSAVVEDGETKA